MRISDRIKQSVASFLYYTGQVGIYIRLFPAKEPTILMYHKIDIERFHQQMDYLKRHYNVVSLKEIISRLKSGQGFQKNTIAITFDDGYINNYKAFLDMKEHGFPATLFAVTGYVGTKELSWWDKLRLMVKTTGRKEYTFIFDGKEIELDLASQRSRDLSVSILHRLLSRYAMGERAEALRQLSQELGSVQWSEENGFMSWKQLQELHSYGFEIGAHTHSHPFLSSLHEKEIEAEIGTSKKILETKLGTKAETFCYPSGDLTKTTKHIVMSLGFSAACGIRKGTVNQYSDIFCLDRVGVNIKDDLPIFSLKVAGIWARVAEVASDEYA
ncbi:MAG: polysaccharide deacetylase family protein [Nanoarchaeota archaeon]|nr:polysaccharide deacetylase family protein [Nanoarchaeota archaeon]